MMGEAVELNTDDVRALATVATESAELLRQVAGEVEWAANGLEVAWKHPGASSRVVDDFRDELGILESCSSYLEGVAAALKMTDRLFRRSAEQAIREGRVPVLPVVKAGTVGRDEHLEWPKPKHSSVTSGATSASSPDS